MTVFFDYDLPAELIAQHPCPERDRARLLVVRRGDASLEHHVFQELPALLQPGDLLVLNDTRVLPARLLGRRSTGGKWEGLFLRETEDGSWELLCQSGGRLRPGETIQLDPGPAQLRLHARTPDGHWLARPIGSGTMDVLLLQGRVPLPHYIRKGQEGPGDRDRYQTVFARQPGAVAAPTAGLHFTPAVFDALRQRGIDHVFVTLHVGPGTFQPITASDFTQHRLQPEWGELSSQTAAAINACRLAGGRVMAVGTTTVRLLETVAASGPLRAWSGATDLYIYPPFQFQAADILLTNFHLPRSTLLLLAGAFTGVDLLRRAYMTAIEEKYRFYSYGDAMLIV